MKEEVKHMKIRMLVQKLVRKSKYGDNFLRKIVLKKANFIFASFPKTGRTWMRLTIMKYCQLYYDFPSDPTDIGFSRKWNVKRILFTHDLINPIFCKPSELAKNKPWFYGKKVVLLIRDPKDTMVSVYFERTKRTSLTKDNKKFEGTKSDSIHGEVGGLLTFLYFYKYWYEEKDKYKDFYIIRYEDIHQNPHEELGKLFEFLEIGLDNKKLTQTVEFSKFENMHKMERNNLFKDKRIEPTDKNDPESYKTRKGKVGDYVNHLSSKDIKYIDDKTNEILPPIFGYSNS